MRSSVSRLKVINAAESAGQGVSRCVSMLPLSGKVARYSLYAVAGMAAVGVMSLLRRSPKPMPTPQTNSPQGVSRYLMAQLMTLVLLPWLRQQMLQGEWGAKLRRMHPARMFFRWIGLEK